MVGACKHHFLVFPTFIHLPLPPSPPPLASLSLPQLVRDWWSDYDRHGSGLVTVPQFRRGFPFDVTDDELAAAHTRFINRATKVLPAS